MADEQRETAEQRDKRVRDAEQDRERRAEKSPMTGALDTDDVIRHLITHGPARNDAERDELFAALGGHQQQPQASREARK